ncbi:FkbM family methyltransferase [Salinisphaera hydrothermalis C41B8]|uniref:FkbM family methyltransferase n=2 Tax=Salinisphaera TaxID=180541 RepID=A0A084IQ18_SALHC|nr:FkbM family methyltransferase [Salinisphaera hydrothermalis C41B8]
MFRWQVGSRLLQQPCAMPFMGETRLLVRRGMHGATGNVYVGLMEFEDMAFVLHFLRADDVFLDVGANVGVYSILAASRGADVLAMEPVPSTFEWLLDNVYFNRFNDRIVARNIGVGRESGQVRFTSDVGGATNHVLTEADAIGNAVEVPVLPLDDLATEAAMLKIDVEGFEAEVIQGSKDLLATDALKAVLIELNGLGARYGFNDEDIHHQMGGYGFVPMRYDPFTRALTRLSGRNKSGNTLYIRPSVSLEQRLRAAPAVTFGSATF